MSQSPACSTESGEALVAAVVLNWNQPVDTVECVQSLLELNHPSFWVIVVDNGSTDDSVSHLQSVFGESIDLVTTSTNLGFSGGNNEGIRHALAHGAEYIILVNNDTVAKDANLITVLVDAFRRDPKIGLACPTILYAENPAVPWYAGASYSLWKGGGKHHQRFCDADRPIDTGYATGCCIMASRPVIETVGFLDETFFLYEEDVDWSLRAKKAGFRIVYVPATTILHKVSRSSGAAGNDGTYSAKTVYYKFRNHILLVRKHGNGIQKYLLWPIYIGGQVLIHSLGYLLLRRLHKFRAMVKGIVDGVNLGLASHE